MAITTEGPAGRVGDTSDRRATPSAPGLMSVAALASLGAGVVHAAAAAAHNEHPAAVAVFAFVALFQVGWAVVAASVPHRRVALLGAAGNGGALAGWVLAKLSGIPMVEGLHEAESLQLADTVAAALALAAVVAAASSSTTPVPGARRLVAASAVAVMVASLTGVVAAGDHVHGRDLASHGGAVGEDDHTEAVVPPKPYDPNKPIDLGGVEGVTPEQQAQAENLIAVTLLRLPKYADPAVAEADGFRSIGDGFTGYEHYIQWSYIDDDRILDPDYPESLVYQVRNGQKTLVAAMYMLKGGATLDDVPDIGGKLMQWHVHTDLCFTPDAAAPRVAGLTQPDGTCRAPLQKGTEVPMVHVWIVPHECGPFAALEGVAGGQIKAGETRLCDHAHGAPTTTVPTAAP